MSNSADELLDKLSNISSDLMLLGPSSSDEEITAVAENLEDLESQFNVLANLEDSDQLDDILTLIDSLLSRTENLTDEESDIEESLPEIQDDFQTLESRVRAYGQSVDSSSSDKSTDEGTGGSTNDSFSRDELSEMDYTELQSLAKDRNIKANQSTEDLVEELAEGDSQDTQNNSQMESSGEHDQTLVTDPDSYDSELFYDFFSEATEHLESFEDVLLTLENERDEDALNRGFRGMHSIKGAAGFLDLRWVNNLSHAMEDLLGLYRDEGYEIEENHIDLLFDGLDALKKLINLHHDSLTEHKSLELDFSEFHTEIDRVRKVIEEIETGGSKVDQVVFEPDEEPSGSDEAEGDVELRETESIRVDTSKIDTIVNRAGELVTTFNQLQRQADRGSHENESRERRRMYNQMDRIVSDIQEEALSLRMVPLKKTFSKTRRMVRDLSKEFGKEVSLTIEGEDTELDRSLVEKIQDPLVHLVRNALDHGIETPEERREKGKDEEGSLTISAYHQSGDVIIEIADDGAGIDPDAIFEEAVEKGLVSSGDELSEREIYMLLFEPGFSTTEEVTDVSGRGVGMDVVRKNVESIRGQIEVESKIDQGTTFRLKIPLTLSIINGMILKLGDQRFVVPTTNILRSLSPDENQLTTLKDRGEVLNLRDEYISLCRLNRLFNLDVEDRAFTESLIVIVQGGGGKVGLQVDDILGQQEVVIKSLGLAFEELRGISGAAILGDGQVGLILDTQTLEDVVRA